MFCSKCGQNNPDGAQWCSGCGAQLQGSPQPTQMAPADPPKTSPMAIWSLILGILGLLTCGVGAVVGLVLGVFGLKQIKDNPQQYTGRGLAVAGIVISAIMFLIGLLAIPAAILFPVFSRARQTAQAASCMNRVKELATCTRMYLTDYDNVYPPAARWCDATKPYAERMGMAELVYCCPATHRLNCGYAINGSVAGRSEGTISSSETILLFESDRGWNASGGRETMITQPRHGFYSISCVDGHAIRAFPSYESNLRWSP